MDSAGYTIAFEGPAPAYERGAMRFPAERPFHVALDELISEKGPVTLSRVAEDQLRAMAAGAFVDPALCLDVLARALGAAGSLADIEAVARATAAAYAMQHSKN